MTVAIVAAVQLAFSLMVLAGIYVYLTREYKRLVLGIVATYEAERLVLQHRHEDELRTMHNDWSHYVNALARIQQTRDRDHTGRVIMANPRWKQ